MYSCVHLLLYNERTLYKLMTDIASAVDAVDAVDASSGVSQLHETETLQQDDKRLICGQVVKFDHTANYTANQFDGLDEKALDTECNGKDHEAGVIPTTLYRPMSEKQYYYFKNMRGFLEYNGGNYAGYLTLWYAKHSDKIPCKSAMAYALSHLTIRKKELDDLNGCNIKPDVELAKRNLLVAKELYAWTKGGKLDGAEDALSSIIGENIDFFDEYKIGEIDYWIVPSNLVEFLEDILKKNGDQYYVMNARHDFKTEFLYDDETILYTGYIPRKHNLVCTREAGVRITEVTLDYDELLKRKRVQNQADRDARKKRRDEGYQE